MAFSSPTRANKLLEIRHRQGFLRERGLGALLQQIAAAFERACRPFHRTSDGFANGAVNLARRLLGIAALEPARRLRALKKLGVLPVIGQLSQFRYHPILGDVTA